MHRATAVAFAAVAAALVASPSGLDARVARSSGLANKKAAVSPPSEPVAAQPSPVEVPERPALLATLVQTHTDERVPLDERAPTAARFSALLADRVTGERHDFDARLLDLLRALARKYPAARIELVSGYRSAKINEAMRKKGRHVASRSQHSLGHAVDFRILPAGADKGIDPRALETEIRELGWKGGLGVYPLKSDWFVHADVGRQRRWGG